MTKAGFEGYFTNHYLMQSSTWGLYQSSVSEQVNVETTGHQSFDRVREYKYKSSTLKWKASEILQGAFPKKVEKDVEGKEEELFENHVKHNKEKEMGLNKKVLEEKNDEEDYYLSVEIRTNSTKIVI